MLSFLLNLVYLFIMQALFRCILFLHSSFLDMLGLMRYHQWLHIVH